jgi:RND superfamily putative drug exporter
MERPSALLPARESGTEPPGTPARPPVVERVAGWSARHRKTALLGWLLLVACAVALGSTLGTKNLNSYDPGQAGQAERVLSRPGVVQRPTETVLIQARASGRTVANDPQLRQAARQVAAALNGLPRAAIDVRSPATPGAHGLRAAPRS